MNQNATVEEFTPNKKDDAAWFKMGDGYKELLVIRDLVVALS